MHYHLLTTPKFETLLFSRFMYLRVSSTGLRVSSLSYLYIPSFSRNSQGMHHLSVSQWNTISHCEELSYASQDIWHSPIPVETLSHDNPKTRPRFPQRCSDSPGKLLSSSSHTSSWSSLILAFKYLINLSSPSPLAGPMYNRGLLCLAKSQWWLHNQSLVLSPLLLHNYSVFRWTFQEQKFGVTSMLQFFND